VGPEAIAQYLSSADVGLCPDLKTPLNDVSTMNKTMEFMAYALPMVSFDLVETRVSAGDTAIYVPSGDVQGFADAVERLLEDPALRVQMGVAARQRVSAELDWRPQAARYVAVFDDLAGVHRDTQVLELTAGSASALSAQNVDLEEPAALARFVEKRSRTDR
jgi:glycosyltransferase involved in cell wall biosynthesis